MIFRQLFEPVSSTYTYLVACEDSGQAVLIDPVVSEIERDLTLLHELGLTLAYTIDTHIHADHITAALALKQRTGSQIAAPAFDRLPCTDLPLEEGKPLKIGTLQFEPLHTPGHTDGHFSFVLGDRVFTGDALLIDGCGRTDFQNGDATQLYQSVREKLFTLPEDMLVYPGHDYQHRRVSSIGQERNRNPRLNLNKTLEEFVEIMAELDLPNPKFMQYAVPGNNMCGVCPENLPQELENYCYQIKESRQG